MDNPVFDTEAMEGAAADEPRFEPPAYLPSSYQPVQEPVVLKPKFDSAAVTSAPAPNPATMVPSPAADAHLPSSLPQQSVAEALQNMPAPQVGSQQQSAPVSARSVEASKPRPELAAPEPQPVRAAAPQPTPAPAAAAEKPPIAEPVPVAVSVAPPAQQAAQQLPSQQQSVQHQPVQHQQAPAHQQAPLQQPASQQGAPQQSSFEGQPPSQQPPAQQPHFDAQQQPSQQAPAQHLPPQQPPISAPSQQFAQQAPAQQLPPQSPAFPVPAPEGSVPQQQPFTQQHAPQEVPVSMSQPTASAPTVFTARRDPDLNPDFDLDAALQQVLMTGGSDLHVSVGAAPMIRVDGALRPMAGAPVWGHDKVHSALYSILKPNQQKQFEEALEFDFAYTLSENARFRVNFYRQRQNLGAAFRLIPTEIKPLAALGVPDSIASYAKLARGLVLVTGPTGSGKSTTLAALIDLVNRTRTDHIMTVEDPIEFLHTNHKSLVNQREVGDDTHNFGAALKHVLRQDPDVILIGELRDLETISVALTAAETGHLVFATLHTQSAPQTIDRIIDVFPPHQQEQVRAQLASTLQGVVCQTLVKRANGRGRVVATEVLMATHAVANLIREGKTYQVHSSMQAGRELGMHTLDQHLADLVNSGQISWDAAAEKSHDIEVLKRLVTRVDAQANTFGANMSTDGVNFSDAYSGQM